MKSGKVWGETTELLRTPVLEVHRLVVMAGAHCSWHKHKHRVNAFVLNSGSLTIEVEQADYPLTDLTDMKPGDLVKVAPGLWHRFVAGPDGAELLELYYPAPLEHMDIERRDVGGAGHPIVGMGPR